MKVPSLLRLWTGGAEEATGPAGDQPPAARLPYNKLCNLEDFSDPDLRDTIRAVFPHEIERFGQRFPRGREYRKYWEVAMAARALRDLGALHPEAEVLGVGAGNEPTIFWLTTQVRRVFATDLYLAGGAWEESANTSMLANPAGHWPGAWNPRRLVVQHMNALDLHYEDGSFDGVFSSSSLEHFGSLADVRRSTREMFRVLKPGGVLSLSTEFRLAGPAPGLPGVLMFGPEEIQDYILGDLPWQVADAPDFGLSAATRKTEQPIERANEDLRRHLAQHGQIVFHRLDWSTYPHIVLRNGEHVFTSIHLALRKPACAA